MIYGSAQNCCIAIVAFQIFGHVQKSYYFTISGSVRPSVDQHIDHADMEDGGAAAVHTADTAQSKMMRNSQLARGQDTRLQKSFDTNFDTG